MCVFAASGWIGDRITGRCELRTNVVYPKMPLAFIAAPLANDFSTVCRSLLLAHFPACSGHTPCVIEGMQAVIGQLSPA